LAAERSGVDVADEMRVAAVARRLAARFDNGRIYLDNEAVTDAIRAESVSAAASHVAALPAVRTALLERQRGFREAPGLVADGRDMGSVVFPDAVLKVFLTASVETRAERRHKQLMDKGITASIRTLSQDLRARDARDAERSVAPLRRMPDAYLLDTTHLNIDQAVAQVLSWYRDVSREAKG
jgi:3-phosphoshikimate 1-carboxyvinyltransferase